MRSFRELSFCEAKQEYGAASREPLVVVHQTWTVMWKWKNGVAPECLNNVLAQYNVSPLRHVWLVPHNEWQHGEPRGFVLLMAVRQNNQCKVRPVLDYHELNDPRPVQGLFTIAC